MREALSPAAMQTGRPSLDKGRLDLRPLFTVSIHTGLRWSEQRALRWADADFLTGFLTVRHSKTGYARQVPMNSLVRSQLMDLAGQREHPADPQEPVFRCQHQQPDKFFPAAVARARTALVKAGKDVARLEGYTWHCNRHTFASRLGGPPERPATRRLAHAGDGATLQPPRAPPARRRGAPSWRAARGGTSP